MHGKNHEIFNPYNFWTPVKRNIPDVWNGNCWILFGSEIEVGEYGPPGPLVATPLMWEILLHDNNFNYITYKFIYKFAVMHF